MSFLAAFVMRGRMQATLLAFSLALVSLFLHPLLKPFVIIVSFASIALVALRKGALEGLYVLLYATAATALLAGLLAGELSFSLMMIVSCLMMWLPVWIVAVVLREGRHLTLTIEVAVFMAVLGVIGFYVYVDSPALLWQQMFEPFLQALPENSGVELEKLREGINKLSYYMTGISMASTLLAVLFSLFLARWWQSVLFNPGGFKHEFLSLQSSSRLAIISLLIVGLAAFSTGLTSELAWNISILLFVLYVFIGTSVLHTVFANMKQSQYLVPMLYITIFLIPHILLPIATVGLCDVWLNLRKIQPTPMN